MAAKRNQLHRHDWNAPMPASEASQALGFSHCISTLEGGRWRACRFPVMPLASEFNREQKCHAGVLDQPAWHGKLAEAAGRPARGKMKK
jgi:hypothetical protein